MYLEISLSKKFLFLFSKIDIAVRYIRYTVIPNVISQVKYYKKKKKTNKKSANTLFTYLVSHYTYPKFLNANTFDR